MKTTIDKAGRVVIPAVIRKELGLHPGTELEVTVRGFTVQLSRSALGPELVRVGKRLMARPTAPPEDRPAVDLQALIDGQRNRWP